MENDFVWVWLRTYETLRFGSFHFLTNRNASLPFVFDLPSIQILFLFVPFVIVRLLYPLENHFPVVNVVRQVIRKYSS